MAKVIRYSINPDGSISLDFEGFRGKTCIEEFQRILEALKAEGVAVDGDIVQELKQEYYQEQEEVVEQSTTPP